MAGTPVGSPRREEQVDGEAQQHSSRDVMPSSSSSGVDAGTARQEREGSSADGGNRPAKKRSRKGWKGWALVDENGNIIEPEPSRKDDEDRPTPGASREGSAAEVEPKGGANGGSSAMGVKRAHKSSSPAHSGIASAKPASKLGTPAEPTRKAPDPTRSADAPAQKKRRKNSPSLIVSNGTARPPINDSSVSTSASTPKTQPLPPTTAKAKNAKASGTAMRGLAGPLKDTASSSRINSPALRPSRDEPNAVPLARMGMGEGYPAPPESDIRSEAMYIIDAARRHRETVGKANRWYDPEKDYLPDGGEGFPPMNGSAGAPTPVYITPITADLRVAPQQQHQQPHRRSSGSSSSPDGTEPRSAGESSRHHHHLPDAHLPPIYIQSHDSSGQTVLVPATSTTRSSRHPPSSDPAAAIHLPTPLTFSQPRPLDDSFESHFGAVQDFYKAREAARPPSPPLPLMHHPRTADPALGAPPRSGPNSITALQPGPDDMKPPRFFEGQRPTVVLAPPGSQRGRPANRVEKSHQEGLEGVTSELAVEAEGFVQNVRENLRNIIKGFFPHPGPRRDAFLESIGRGLVDLGWNLTDNGDAALGDLR